MELTQLRYFCAVAETQHMTKTAERLHIAQPALTQSIHRLEKELGVALFAARGRGIELTECGRYFYKSLTPVLRTLEDLPRELRAMANVEDNTVHMNMLAASTLLTASVIEYKRQQHHTNFQLFQSSEMETCDLTVSTTTADEKVTADGCRTFYCAEPVYLAVPRNGRYGGRTSIGLAEVAGEEFVCLGGAFRQFRTLCNRFCERAGFSPNVIFESDVPGAVRNLIAAGMGVGFWPEFTWGVLDTSEVRLLPIHDTDCRRNLVVRCSGGGREARNYYEFLAEYFRRYAEVVEVE